MELLPAQRNIRIVQHHAQLTEGMLHEYDAAILICEREQAETLLQGLPFAGTWQQLYRQASEAGPVTLLNARLAATGAGGAATKRPAAARSAIPMVVAFVKSSASAFERLALGARAWKALAAPGGARVLLATAGLESASGDAVLEALLAAVLAGSTPMPSLKSKAPQATTPAQLTLLATSGRVAPAVDVPRCLAIDRGNHLARWLTTLPPNVLGSKSYVRALRQLARQQQWDFAFLGEAALRKQNAGAFLAVAQANEHRDAGIVRLHYRGAGRTRSSDSRAQITDGASGVLPAGSAFKRLALVGKGICFDTGGINLKSHKSMYQMHEDMQGSSVALGTLLALSELNVPYDIECWLAITENQTGARAFRPQDVVRAANGVSIQVVHSDAEGRMVLADTLALAARGKASARPDLIVDFATLTGACVGALTERYSGVFTNRPEWHAALEQCGRSSGERVWPFPMDEDYDSELESSIADVLQCSPDGKGDHILAARFLNRFVPAEIPWVHLDLAASHRSGGLAHVPTDFTGFGVRYATTLLLDGHLQRPSPGQNESGRKPASRKPRPAGSRARPGGAAASTHVRSAKHRQNPS